jgi:type II secretory ATPase GspE/PulE/Tfp pilus assembly ATPase PilB-like protein
MKASKEPSSNNVVGLVEQLLARAIERRASDIHFEPRSGQVAVRYRIDGLLQDVDRLPLEMAEGVVARLKVLAGLLTYRIDIPQEGSFPADPEWIKDSGPIDLRVATFPTVRGERVVVRALRAMGTVTELEGLGLSPGVTSRLVEAVDRPAGLLIVTGPAGSGKSTTLYALARRIIAHTPWRSVVSLEDPVEQRVEGLAQIQVNPHGELNYLRAMRSMLRQDVEVLLVGEVRDAETAHIVVEASLTGHLIMSTMHSGDPAEAIARLLEMGIAPYQLVGALSAVCTQRLLRTLCSSCEGKGCERCLDSGYAGRTACGQVAVMDEALRGAVLQQYPASDLRKLINERTADLTTDGKRLVAEDRTTSEELRRVLGCN